MKSTAYCFAKEVDRKIEELTRDDYLRRKGRGKRLREELYPISRLALHLKQPGLEIEVEASEDDGPVDGHIREFGFCEQEFDVEVTSDYGHDESLRDELLVAESFTWGTGEIRRDKTSLEVVATPGGLITMRPSTVSLKRWYVYSETRLQCHILRIQYSSFRSMKSNCTATAAGIRCCRALTGRGLVRQRVSFDLSLQYRNK